MKEILYIQGGRFANHIGTHFWNAQQSYFTYGEDAEDPIVHHNVSFREGVNFKVRSIVMYWKEVIKGAERVIRRSVLDCYCLIVNVSMRVQYQK